MTQITIDKFRERILSLRPNNFMALNGAAPGIVGSSSAGADVILGLQRATIEFSRAYKEMQDKSSLSAIRRDILGKIMVALTVDAISQREADELIEALHQLMERRK